MSDSEAADLLVERVKSLIMALEREQIVALREWMHARFDVQGNEHPYNTGA